MYHRFCLVSLSLLLLAGKAYGQCNTLGVYEKHSGTVGWILVEKFPQFPIRERKDKSRSPSELALKFITDSLQISSQAKLDNIKGRVYFSFVVDIQGHTSDIKILKGLRPDVDAEVMRNVYRLMQIQWQPALTNGKPLCVPYTLFITI